VFFVKYKRDLINLINTIFIMYFDLNVNYDNASESLEDFNYFSELVSSAISGKLNP